MSRKYIPKRRREGTTGFSLFPFLTVLLCTMGALIMLLVLVARNVREQGASAAVEKQPEIVRQIEPEPVPATEDTLTVEKANEILSSIHEETENVDWIASELVKSKKLAEEQLADERAKLAMVEKETQKVRDELVRLEKIVRELESNTAATPEEITALKAILEQKKSQRMQSEGELEKLQDESKRNAKSYAIIPYRGSAGTFRRPIFLECYKNKIVLQPEGTVFEGTDLMVPDRADNPIDAALRAVRQYLNETGQLAKGTEPYPLLIVRPSGVDAYSAARESMGTWVNEYGYELVDEDWTVNYPPPSQELRERVEKQVEIARNRTEGYLAIQEMERKAAARSQQYRVDSKGVVQRMDGNLGPGRGMSSGPNVGPRYGYGNCDDLKNAGVPTERVPFRRPNVPGTGNGTAMSEQQQQQQADAAAGNSLQPFNGPMLPGDASPKFGAPYGSGQPLSSALGAKKEDDLISLEVPDPSKREKPTLYLADAQGAPQGSNSERRSNLYRKNDSTGQSRTLDHHTPSQGDNRNATTSGQPMNGQPGQACPMGDSAQQGQPAIGMSAPLTAGRAENWAIKGASRFATGIARNVRIQCEADKLVLVPQPGLLQVRVVSIGDSMLRATDNMVRAVNDYTDSWGMAGENMYWKPTLKVKVLPGGERRFAEFQQLLRNSGMVVEEEIGVRR